MLSGYGAEASVAPLARSAVSSGAALGRGPRPAPSAIQLASLSWDRRTITGGSTIIETVGRDRFRIRVLRSIEGSRAVVTRFAERTETVALPRGFPVDPLELLGTGPFGAVELQLTNTGKTAEPSDGEGVAALANGLPLMVAANPSVVRVSSRGPTGLRCPSRLSPPSATNFGPDGNGKLCVEMFNAVAGPMISPASSNPTMLPPGHRAIYLCAFTIPRRYSLAVLHLALNTASAGDEGTWNESVPVIGRPKTIRVALPAGFTAGDS